MAVLPLQNLSGEPSQEYFSEGLTEELITQLGGFNPEKLRVIARTSVARYKEGVKSVEEIGRELHVEFVIEGTECQSGCDTRVVRVLPDRHGPLRRSVP